MRSLSSTKQWMLSGVLALAVSPALAATTNTTLTVTAAGSPVTSIASGTVVTLTAAVLAGSTPVTPGLVNFCDATATYCTDVHIVGSAQLTGSGTASFRFVPGVGDHSYKAVFVGTNTNAASVSSASALTVTGPGPSITSIVSSGVATNLTLAATVSSAAGPAPAGSVSFLDASTANARLGTATLGAPVSGLSFRYMSSQKVDLGVGNIITGDFNSDGHQDMLVPDQNQTTNMADLLLYLGKGDGTFQLPITINEGSNIYLTAVGDFNGDDKLDVALINKGNVVVLLGNGDGSFQPPLTTTTTNPHADFFAMADFNGDGNQDLALLHESSDDSIVYLTMLLGKGDGTFRAAPNTVIPPYRAGGALVPADFNGDGKLDLAVGGNEILTGKGDGTFNVSAPSPEVCCSDWLVSADFNGDGKPDLAFAGGDAVGVLLNNGDGTFTSAPVPAVGDVFYGLAVGDFNADGRADLATADSPREAAVVLLGNGDGTFASHLLPGAYPNNPAVADFNGDGTSDLAVVNDVYPDAIVVSLTTLQSATAAATGLSLPSSPGTQSVVASYAGDSSNLPSLSPHIAIPLSAVTLSPASLVFAPTYVGDSSGYQQITLSNSTSTTLAIPSIVAYTNFQVRERTCGNTLAANDSCTFSIVFKPKECCDIFDEVVLVGKHVSLFGVGKDSQVVTYPSTLFTFGPIAVGNGLSQSVTVTNQGDEPVVIRSIEITNTKDPYAWEITGQACGSSLAATASCSFAVVFRPTRTGTSTANVSIDITHGHKQQKISLTGIGK